MFSCSPIEILLQQHWKQKWMLCTWEFTVHCVMHCGMWSNIAGLQKKSASSMPSFGFVREQHCWCAQKSKLWSCLRNALVTISSGKPSLSPHSVSKYFKHLTTLHPKHCWPYLCLTFSNPIFSAQFSLLRELAIKELRHWELFQNLKTRYILYVASKWEIVCPTCFHWISLSDGKWVLLLNTSHCILTVCLGPSGAKLYLLSASPIPTSLPEFHIQLVSSC